MCQVPASFVAGCACLYSRNTGEDGLRYIAGDRRSHGYAHDKGCSGRGQVCARGPVDGDAARHGVYACSPEFAHLGATAQAIPRPEPGRTATVSILAVPCHRDEIPAHDIAAALATRFGVPVVASTGFHVENATADDLRRMLDTTKELIAALEEAAARILRAGWDEGGAGAEVVAVDAATGEALGPGRPHRGPYRRGNPASGISDASGRGPGRRRAVRDFCNKRC